MSTWTASHLPKIRDQLHRLLADPNSGVRHAAGDIHAAEHLARSEQNVRALLTFFGSTPSHPRHRHGPRLGLGLAT
ncbi:hypothetical protein AB0M36_13960 [Actinoplanes sp. NPDC051346]|uniref:hypothetical protein n=1 Tax=Actinoplanes sp. NPDC051346 TaxID=3155048 RepID=UPI00342F6411